MSHKKIFLINPILADESENLSIPLALLYLASSISRKDWKVVIVDLNFEWLKRINKTKKIKSKIGFQKRIIKEIVKEKGPPDLVGITGLCDNFHFTIELAQFLKKYFNSTVLLGGPHATFISEEILNSFSFVDYILKGDGTFSLPIFLDFLSNGVIENIEIVPNLVWRNSGNIIRSSEVKRANTFLNIALNYDLLPFREYLLINPEMSVPILAGQGCPYSCSFCSTSLMWARKYLTRKPSDVAAEILYFKKRYGISSFSLVHDNLLLRKDFAFNLSKELAPIDISWSCSGRLDDLGRYSTRELKFIRDSGCTDIFIGVETGSEKLQASLKKNIAPNKVLPILKKLQSIDISTTLSFIIGFPDESLSDFNSTVRLAFSARRGGARRVIIGNLVPLPGTEIARKNKKVKKNPYNALGGNLLSSDDQSIELIDGFPNIFSSFYFFKQRVRLGKYNFARVAINLHTFISDFPLAFGYLFINENISPSKMLPVLDSEVGDALLLIEKSLPRKIFYKFQDILKYEELFNELLEAGASVLDVDHQTSISVEVAEETYLSLNSNVRLLKSSFDLVSYCCLNRNSLKKLRTKTTFLLLVNRGDLVETFAVEERLFNFLSQIEKRKLCLSEFLGNSSNKNRLNSLLSYLNQIKEMRGLRIL